MTTHLEWARAPPAPLAALHLTGRKDGAVVFAADLSGRAAATFGRNSGQADFALDHASLSRLHAAVARDAAGAVFVVDLGSTHGTFVRGARLAPFAPRRVAVDDKADVIVFGGSTRAYHLTTTKAAAPAGAEAPQPRPPPPPPVPQAATRGGADDEEDEDEREAKAAAQRVLERRQREEGLRAAIASFKAPIVASEIRHPVIGGGSGGGGGGGDGGGDGGGSDIGALATTAAPDAILLAGLCASVGDHSGKVAFAGKGMMHLQCMGPRRQRLFPPRLSCAAWAQ